MKTKILSLVAILAMAIGMGACSEDWTPKTEKTGQVVLKDNLGVTVEDAANVVSRAEHDLNNFLVKIFNEQNVLIEQWTYSALPEIFSLPVGSYRVDVCSHEVQKAEWDKPYFFGSKEFKIENSQITEIGNITCKFASIRVSVKFTEELKAAMADDVKVRVVVNDLGEMVFTTADESRSAYYEAVEGSTTMAAFFTGTVNGYKENFHQVFGDVTAGQHRIITFSLRENPIEPDPETGFINPENGINIDISVNTEDTNGNITPDEDPIENPGKRPGDEDFKENVDLKYDATSTTLNVEAQAGIQSFTFAFSSSNAEATAAFASINGIDLTNTTSASVLGAYDIPTGSAVAGQTNLSINLAKLEEAIKEYEGTHTLSFAVTDTKGNAANGTAVIKGKSAIEPITFKSELCFDTPMNPSKESDGLVKIIAPAGIAHLVVDIESDNDDFASVTEMISGADFAHPSSDELAQTLTGFKLANGAEVLNQTEVNFDITMFLSPAFLPGFPGTHKFTLTVTDNDGNEKSVTLIFEVQ